MLAGLATILGVVTGIGLSGVATAAATRPVTTAPRR
jgi:hypothetical protein